VQNRKIVEKSASGGLFDASRAWFMGSKWQYGTYELQYCTFYGFSKYTSHALITHSVSRHRDRPFFRFSVLGQPSAL
jgi:hypothetical protein